MADCERAGTTHEAHMIYPAGEGPPSHCPGRAAYGALRSCGDERLHPAHLWQDESAGFVTLRCTGWAGQAPKPPPMHLIDEPPCMAQKPGTTGLLCTAKRGHDPARGHAAHDGWTKLIGSWPALADPPQVPQGLKMPGITNMPDVGYGHELILIFGQDSQLDSFRAWLDGPGWAAYCGWAESQDHDEEKHGD